jgi:hypothetical protein
MLENEISKKDHWPIMRHCYDINNFMIIYKCPYLNSQMTSGWHKGYGLQWWKEFRITSEINSFKLIKTILFFKNQIKF